MKKALPIEIQMQQWRIVRDILQRHVPQYDVWAFGSRARRQAKPYSDLDLAVVSDKPLSIEQCAAMEEEFSQSDLPWKVDLVDWSTVSAGFRSIIEQEKVVVQRGRCRKDQSSSL